MAPPGQVIAYRGGQPLFGPYRPPEAGTDVAAVEVKFIDDTHGTGL